MSYALPHGTGSLSPTFVSARRVGLAVKPACAFTLDARLPTALSRPLRSSVTLWEETAPVKLPSYHCPSPGFTGIEVRPQTAQGWYFKDGSTNAGTAASKPPTYPTQTCAQPISAYSKGSRGLSVLPRVCGIFTTTTISPSRLLRQCSSRYAIHARRNLPDKEFRYLRTVIVTAAIDRCFGCKLRRS
jgi:hypothetical protein